MKIATALNTIALIIALFVQSMGSPLAGAWLFFLFAGCSLVYCPPRHKNIVYIASAVWLLTLGISTFLLAPIINGAATMWILAAMPLVALTVREESIDSHLDAFMAVIVIYAFGLILQSIIGVRFNNYEYYLPSRHAYAMSWPLLDPNNAAAVINCGLIPSFYMALKKPKWFFLVILFAIALFITASKAGALAAILMCGVLLWEQFGAVPVLILSLPAVYFIPEIVVSFTASLNNRIPIWAASIILLKIHPLKGLGLGSFGFYYHQIKTETYTAGWYAHNDLLQWAVEIGIPAVTTFFFLIYSVIKTTCRRNIVSACVLLAVFLQAMVEFQFYLPSISILMGLALAYHSRLLKPVI